MPRRSLLHLEAAGLTDPGCVYPENQDSLIVRPDLGLFVVADGMSRPAGGGLASSLATRSVEQSFERSGRWKACSEKVVRKRRRLLTRSFQRANDCVLDVAEKQPENRGMGTTIAALALAGDRVVLAHVGDSRIYRVRGEWLSRVRVPWSRKSVPRYKIDGPDGGLERMTVDHSVREDPAYRVRRTTDPDLMGSDNGRILTQVLGRGGPLRIPCRVERVESGDAYLLCTDGVYEMVTDEELSIGIAEPQGLRAVMIKTPGGASMSPAQMQCAFPIQRAKRRGGYDNLTLLVVRFVGPPDPPEPEPEEEEDDDDDDDDDED